MKVVLLEDIGQEATAAFASMGRFTFLVRSTLVWALRAPIEWRQVLIQMQRIGVESLPVTTMTTFFTGMVLALQSGASSKHFFNEPLFVGTVVSFAMVMELGPVMTALVVSGRAGAAIAAELGTMKVTEQIDALECLATDPIHYLFVPRLLASMLVVPLLTVVSIYVGFWGGYLILVGVEGQSAYVYGNEFYKLLAFRDLRIAIYKSIVFGMIIALVGCWKGYRTYGGAEGVGNAPTSSVVTSSLWILISDFFLTKLLLV